LARNTTIQELKLGPDGLRSWREAAAAADNRKKRSVAASLAHHRFGEDGLPGPRIEQNVSPSTCSQKKAWECVM